MKKLKLYISVILAVSILVSYSNCINADNSGSRSFVERLYVYCLGRGADQEGCDYWDNQLQQGVVTGTDLAKQFFFSDELQNRNISDEDFVNRLYFTLLNRASDALLYWSEIARTEGRDFVFYSFTNCPEWETICDSYGIVCGNNEVTVSGVEGFVSRLYQQTLNRLADSDGMNYWRNELIEQRLSGSEVAESFFNSEEFLLANYSNDDYICKLYNVFFDRNADDEGMHYWSQLLDSGKSRNDILEGFANSNEWIEICNQYGIKSLINRELDYCALYSQVLYATYDFIMNYYSSDHFEYDESIPIDYYAVGDGLQTWYGRWQSGEEILDDIGFYFVDLNNDGVKELVVGIASYYCTKINVIFGVYALENNQPKLVVNGWNRNSFCLLDNGNLLNHGSNGAAYGISAVYSLDTNNRLVVQQYYFTWESPNYEGLLYYFNTTGIYDRRYSREIAKEEYDRAMEYYESRVADITFIPLASLFDC